MEQTSGGNHQNTRSGKGEQAKERVRHAAQRTEQKAGQVAHQARQKAKGQLSTQKERAAGTLGGVAQALRQSGKDLQEQDQRQVGHYTERAADQVERFSGYLRERNVDQLMGEAENLARKRPTLFLGGAFALGLLGTRFLKSSSSGQGSGTSQHGSSSTGDGSREAPTATSRGAISYGAQEEATMALPPEPIDEEHPSAAGQPLREPTEPPPPRRGSF